MNKLSPEISAQLLNGYSWCVSYQSYNLEKRHFIIRVVDNPEDCKSERELKWQGIKMVNIQLDEEDPDDDCMDGIIGIHQEKLGEQYHIYIQSDKYSIEFYC